jgi:peptidyl-prolyl cis-trans isomerase B (cyclophilin B)
MNTKIFTLILSLFCCVVAQAQVKKSPATITKVVNKKKEAIATEKLVEITTDYGVMIARLYDSTSKHRDNFLKLVNQKFYDSLLFHRVINGFMIQGGDPTSKNADSTTMLGGGSAPGERIPAEFNQNFFHKKGALAAARDGNPEKASSNCQFYIVQGKKIDTAQLRQTAEQRMKANHNSYNYTASQKEIYQRIGGTPFLDQNYTVFGEVISGLNVLDAIANTPTQPSDRPKKDIRMKIRLLN